MAQHMCVKRALLLCGSESFQRLDSFQRAESTLESNQSIILSHQHAKYFDVLLNYAYLLY